MSRQPSERIARFWRGVLARQIDRWRAAGVEAEEVMRSLHDWARAAHKRFDEIDFSAFHSLVDKAKGEGILCVHAAVQLDRSLGVMRGSLPPQSDRGRVCERARSAFDAIELFTAGDAVLRGMAPRPERLRDLLEHFDAYASGDDEHYVDDEATLAMMGTAHGETPSVVWASRREGSTLWIALRLDAIEAWDRNYVAPLLPDL
jgi:hypothetical protein